MKKASTTKEVILRIYTQRGIGGLFAGLVPRIAKIGKLMCSKSYQIPSSGKIEVIFFYYSPRLRNHDKFL